MPFLASFEQKLHAEADAEGRLFDAEERIAEAKRVYALYRIAGRTDARQDHLVGAHDLLRVGRHYRVDAKAPEREPNRSDIAAAEIDDRQLHSRPLVLGSSSALPS